MEKVHKGLMGYSSEKEGKPATHVILTIEEYDNLLGDIRKARSETQRTIEETSSEIANYKSQTENTIKQQKQDAQKRIEGIQSDFNNAKDEIHRLNDLNANMLRIAKERANSKRGLKPKKVHHGYLVIDSQQYSYIHNYKRNTQKLPCWKVRMQSPYNSSIPYETIIKNITDDLVKVFGASLGIKSMCTDLTNFDIDKIKELWNNDKNFIFRSSYKANIKSGLWEIEYLVKSSIKIPEDMRIQ